MTDKIEPALTAEEWRTLHDGRFVDLDGCRVRIDDAGLDVRGWFMGEEAEVPRASAAAVMAAVNATLPDDDPRKLTGERVRALRALVEAIGEALASKMVGVIQIVGPGGAVMLNAGYVEDYGALADALAALLPPEA